TGGRLLYGVGNGESISGRYDGSDSVIAPTPTLHLADRFAPSTWPDDNAADLDLGSVTPAVVGSHLFLAGKRGVGYTLRLDQLGGIGGEVAQAQVCDAYGGAAVEGNIVFVPCHDGVSAVQIDSAGGIHVRWRASVPAAGSPVIDRGGVWVVDYDAGV